MNHTLLRNLFLSSEESSDLAELLAQQRGIIEIKIRQE